ncbi:MAG: hypothetical protein RSC36_04515 [Ruthenibacterium sp.]
MNQSNLQFHFHNPNPPDITADFLLPLLMEANREQLERILLLPPAVPDGVAT